MSGICVEVINQQETFFTKDDQAQEPEEKQPEFFSLLKPEDIVRGATPDGIEQRCLDLCRTYVGGLWDTVQGLQDITLTRITGGLTNQLYRIRITNQEEGYEVDSDVAIKLFMPKHMRNFESKNENERLSDILVTTILSQVGIGPKVHGICDEAIIQAFYEHDQFGPKHQQDPELLPKLVHQLARVHHLNVPMNKSPEVLLNNMQEMFDDAYANCNAQALIDELKLENLKKFDPRQEFQKLRGWIRALNCPVVFCHNDFRGSNILVTKIDQNIVLTDHEYAAYGYRAHDIANFMREWGREPLDFENQTLQSDDVFRDFIKLYIESCDKVQAGYSSKPENSVETILKEVKVFTLEGYLFLCAFFMRAKENLVAIEFNPKENMKYVEFMYTTKYINIRDQLFQDGTLPL